MSTLSVPLNKDLEEIVISMVKSGFAHNKAEVVRKALIRLAEEEAINEVLRAEKELADGKIMKGDLREIIAKMP
ncbi:TPA: hypothetical protein DEW47_01840 [Patescibacteria group bacterium]|nr:MAG: hypothetical protein UT71_C0022G0005 [Parcubacteria group bacterium GW2011_GWF2_40_10]KKR47474.1 MAG: hypothetical protein UT83_C0009G0040 [Parcubacteria group bacterium GW2011_GWA2_40_143]KKR58965.1 MAG: hypothetical protein UT97_C0019G0005 [Parcubacteria group bacterium GW2011_GWC2_40_31]KKR82194.1 MAG: hypothetical protein UU28_C0013G0005 [Parcubacteria group bacterium GW2011_GWD2_40_9]HBB56577.1 hypothetical protein [Patescibacteria group bacterium]